jgi:prefoldin alpha subunit
MEQQEYLIKLQMLEQQAAQFGEQLKMIDQQIGELDKLKDSIGRLNDSKESEMFSEVGKGIYVKANLDKKQMLVDVGNKILVPKSSKEIQGIVDTQVKKFSEVKNEISNQVDRINKEVDSLISEVSSVKKSKKKGG